MQAKVGDIIILKETVVGKGWSNKGWSTKKGVILASYSEDMYDWRILDTTENSSRKIGETVWGTGLYGDFYIISSKLGLILYE